MSEDAETRLSEAPLGQLELAFIDEFLHSRGYAPAALADLPEDQRIRVLADASIYASGKLVEVEARSHFLDEIRYSVSGSPNTGVD